MKLNYGNLWLVNFLYVLFLNFQSTLCYYDVKDALALASENAEAKTLMASLEKRAKDSRQQVKSILSVNLFYIHVHVFEFDHD